MGDLGRALEAPPQPRFGTRAVKSLLWGPEGFFPNGWASGRVGGGRVGGSEPGHRAGGGTGPGWWVYRLLRLAPCGL